MRQPPQTRERGEEAYAKADYTGETEHTADGPEHYTHLILKDIRGESQRILADAERLRRDPESARFYSITDAQAEAFLSSSDAGDWEALDPYTNNRLRFSLQVPVRYYRGWAPESHLEELAAFAHALSELNFRVYYDGTEVRQPIVLRASGERSFVQLFEFDGDHVGAKGYFFARKGVLRPSQLNGVLVRIRHVAIGGYDSSFLSYPKSTATLFRRWVSCELWADDRLESAMNIDRKTLRVTHPAYQELQSFFHEQMDTLTSRMRKDLYEPGRARTRTGP